MSQYPKNGQSLALINDPRAPSLDDLEFRLRAAIALAIKRSPRSRAEIAEAMAENLGRPISIHALNSWTSETKRRVRFPAIWIPAFCKAAMSDAPQLVLLSPEDRARLEIKKDLESLRSAITALLAAERKRARAKSKGAGRSSLGKKGEQKR